MLKAVVFDWAGTMIDYGCFAPLAVFIEVFKRQGIDVTPEEAREPMGLLKRDHIRAICGMERICTQWEKLYGKKPEETDVEALYAEFEPMMFTVLEKYSLPVPGAVELAERLRERGLKIGSTTGYTAEMMKIVAAAAGERGYAPDAIVASDEVPAGRPEPWMCYENAKLLGVYPMSAMVKVGDTVSDIREGKNAGMWTVGVVKGGSELGWSREQVAEADPVLLAQKAAEAAERFKQAGAHFIIDEIGKLDEVLDQIEDRLARGEKP
ncbi:phosphonoacetaldehyde hydrolase [Brevibacillus borstelensis]|uniref:phosphonoacetaldehyde hydrolase n=1 Tax=Brevibacillus borstelensis TaxID=45462 RepID=UPI0030CD1455